MADKAISELVAATQVTSTDLFVLEQSGTAKKLTGQILENWLVSFADGHGGIQSIVNQSTSGLKDTYRITLADTTTFDFVVTNGKAISNIAKTATSGLVDTYTITYNDSTSSTFTVTNGAKGDKGDNQYVWIKYASQEPTASSHSFGDIPDDWIGVYSGDSATAPTDWTQYKWFQIKGEKGDTGSPATLSTQSVQYQASTSGTVIPSGTWLDIVPTVAQGQYLWTRSTLQFNTGETQTSYSVARFGVDGSGSVSSVNGVSPDEDGNIILAATDVGAVSTVNSREPDGLGEVTLSATDIGAVATVNNKTPDSAGNVSLSASDVGAAATSHTHAASDITSGTLPSSRLPTVPITKGGTGATTAAAALTNLGALAASQLVAVYNASVAFTSGKATYTNSAITTSSVVIVERRVGTAGSSNVHAFGTTSNSGSVTICASDTFSASINLNIVIINP